MNENFAVIIDSFQNDSVIRVTSATVQHDAVNSDVIVPRSSQVVDDDIRPAILPRVVQLIPDEPVQPGADASICPICQCIASRAFLHVELLTAPCCGIVYHAECYDEFRRQEVGGRCAHCRVPFPYQWDREVRLAMVANNAVTGNWVPVAGPEVVTEVINIPPPVAAVDVPVPNAPLGEEELLPLEQLNYDAYIGNMRNLYEEGRRVGIFTDVDQLDLLPVPVYPLATTRVVVHTMRSYQTSNWFIDFEQFEPGMDYDWYTYTALVPYSLPGMTVPDPESRAFHVTIKERDESSTTITLFFNPVPLRMYETHTVRYGRIYALVRCVGMVTFEGRSSLVMTAQFRRSTHADLLVAFFWSDVSSCVSYIPEYTSSKVEQFHYVTAPVRRFGYLGVAQSYTVNTKALSSVTLLAGVSSSTKCCCIPWFDTSKFRRSIASYTASYRAQALTPAPHGHQIMGALGVSSGLQEFNAALPFPFIRFLLIFTFCFFLGSSLLARHHLFGWWLFLSLAVFSFGVWFFRDSFIRHWPFIAGCAGEFWEFVSPYLRRLRTSCQVSCWRPLCSLSLGCANQGLLCVQSLGRNAQLAGTAIVACFVEVATSFAGWVGSWTYFPRGYQRLYASQDSLL